MVVLIRTDATILGISTSGTLLSSMFWLPGTPGGSNADATDALTRFRAFWVGCTPRVSTGQTISFSPVVLAYEDSDESLVDVFAATPVAVASTSGGANPLPQQTQGLVRWTTNGIVNNRRVRGRTFIPVPDEQDNTAGSVPVAGYITALNAAAAALFAAPTTVTAPVVWSRPAPGRPGSSHLILSGSCAPSWSVLRSRR